MIKDEWSEMTKEHKQEWIRAKNSTKDKIIAQFSNNSKSTGPVTKNHQLRTDGRAVYKLDFEDDNGDGYYSDYTANSEATFDFNAYSSVYDTTDDDDSNGESVLEGKELNVNAAAATKSRPSSILKVRVRSPRRKKLYKSSEIPTGAPPKMMASKQLKLMDGDKVVSYMTMAGNMAVMDYS